MMMYQSKIDVSTPSAVRTVESTPVRPAYVINAETIMQCIVGKVNNKYSIMKKYFFLFGIILFTILVTSCSNEYDKDLDRFDEIYMDYKPLWDKLHKSDKVPTDEEMKVMNELEKEWNQISNKLHNAYKEKKLTEKQYERLEDTWNSFLDIK